MFDASLSDEADAIELTSAWPRRNPIGRRVTAWTLWLFLLGNGAIIVWLWGEGGGISAVKDAATLFTSVGRITGLLSAYLALVQVLLLARLPFLEKLAGFDSLTIWHRRNGKVVLYLVLAHVVFITLGYALLDKLSLPSEISTLLGTYPGMIAATLGTALLIVVAVSSFVIVRAKLPYEAWYAIHVTAYAGIALAWVHQVPTGNEFILRPVATAYWTALYVGTWVFLAMFRLAQPMFRAVWHRMRVAEVTVEGPTVISLRITGRRLDRLGVKAGQFFLWRFLSRGRWWESHPFSLSEAPDGTSLRITVKASGDFTRRLVGIRVGSLVVAEGPFGVFTDSVRRRERVALIAGGIGITPVRALAEGMRGDVVVIYRALREEDIVFRAELDQLAHERDVIVHYVVGHHAAPHGERIMSPEHLRELVPDLVEREIYICGPPGMDRFLERNVRAADVPRNQIHIERFAL
jgi:predicted ferric reductase